MDKSYSFLIVDSRIIGDVCTVKFRLVCIKFSLNA